MSSSNQTTSIKPQYRIVEPYRNIGKVIDSNKPEYIKRSHQRLILLSNQYSFCLYSLEKLRIERLSPSFSNQITAFAYYKNKVFVAIGMKILFFDKLHIKNEYTHNEKIVFLSVYENLLFAKDSSGLVLLIQIHNMKLKRELNINCGLHIHPHAYLNKILYTPLSSLSSISTISSYEDNINEANLDLILNQHNLILYNINTSKIIYSTTVLPSSSSSSTTLTKSFITIFENSPLVDIIAIGYSCGSILIINIKTFKIIKEYKAESSIKSITFSNCDLLKIPLLVTSEDNGKVLIWNLENNILLYTFPYDSIGNAVCENVMFIPNEPLLLITSEKGNFIKMFIFNEEESFTTPKLLKERTGFVDSPHKIMFYGDDEKHILAISHSQIKMISTINEHITRSFSTKRLENKNINLNFHDIDINQYRERDWNNVMVLNSTKDQENKAVSYSKSNKIPLLFSSELNNINQNHEIERNFLIGIASLKENEDISSISLSFCGNFGFVGYSKGSIIKFNIQSGRVKEMIRYIPTEKEGVNKKSSRINEDNVISIKADGLNSIVLSIHNTKLVFWDFVNLKKESEIELKTKPIQLEIEKEKDLVGVLLENGKIQIYNKANFSLVREFDYKKYDHNNAKHIINSFCFGNNGKWVLSITSRSHLLIYDIRSNEIIENVVFDKKPLSISMSSNGLLIGVTFENENYVQLLINREKYVDVNNYMMNQVDEALLNKEKEDGNEGNEGKERKEEKQGKTVVIKPIYIIKNEFLNQIKYLSSRIGRNDYNLLDNKDKDNQDTQEFKDSKIGKTIKNQSLIQMSNQNKSKYRLIVYYDYISKITRPSIKAKEKVSAPFFIFNINNLDTILPSNKNKNELSSIINNNNQVNQFETTNFKSNDKSTERLKQNNQLRLNLLLEDLFKNKTNKKGEEVSIKSITSYLLTLSPEILDLEIRNLSPELNIGKKEYLKGFIFYIKKEIFQRRNFEMIHSFLNRFIKIFGESMIFDENYLDDFSRKDLIEIREYSFECMNNLERLFDESMCLVGSLGGFVV